MSSGEQPSFSEEPQQKEQEAPPLPEKSQLDDVVMDVSVPPPYCQKGELGMEGDNYWTQECGENSGEKDCECQYKKKKKGACMFVAILGMLLVAFVAYNVGKRAGFWRGSH